MANKGPVGRRGESAPVDPTKDSGGRIGALSELRDRWAEEARIPKHSLDELNQKAYQKALPGLKTLLPEGATDGWEENMNPSEIVEALNKAIEDVRKEEEGSGDSD